MQLKRFTFLLLTLSLGACSSMIQSTSVEKAYKEYTATKYERTLELITRAENTDETTPEMKAELTYLKAQTYERLGENGISKTLYEYLVNEHSKSQYGYLAAKKLNSNF